MQKYLLDSGADIDASRLEDGCTPLNLAAIRGHVELVKLLAQRGADLASAARSDGSTALHMATMCQVSQYRPVPRYDMCQDVCTGAVFDWVALSCVWCSGWMSCKRC
jgi:hypothetical protein